jgi:ABC-type glycerol-3-phosphate transport system substrate-binding protein
MRRGIGLFWAFAIVIAILALLFALGIPNARGVAGHGLAVIWTDVPEIALYAELFNRSQEGYRVEIAWKPDLAIDLRETKTPPDLVLGHYLKSSLLTGRFRPLDYLFGELAIDQTAFYQPLLALCKHDGKQVLLPVSFNLPTIAFLANGMARPANVDTIGLDELATTSSSYNVMQGSAYVKMGFSPRWNPAFLVIATDAAGAAFHEGGNPLAWSEPGLRMAIDRLRNWSGPGDPGPIEADDFQFKYLYTPEYTWLAGGRALYAYMASSDLFLVPEDKRALLDFRWFSEGGYIPILDDPVFAGIPESRKDEQAAESFLAWLFSEAQQQSMLESTRRTRALESSFGIAGGFSTLRGVTERVFPLYYSNLKGQVPPEALIGEYRILPPEWPKAKVNVVGPWLRETFAKPADREGEYSLGLAARLDQWMKGGRE